jgi:hypothetical protein
VFHNNRNVLCTYVIHPEDKSKTKYISGALTHYYEINADELPKSGEYILGYTVHSGVNPLHGYLLKLQEKENNISNSDNSNNTKEVKYLSKNTSSTVVYYKDDIKNMSKDELIPYNTTTDLENEIEYRYMLMYIDTFDNLGMYEYQYSTRERMENTDQLFLFK